MIVSQSTSQTNYKIGNDTIVGYSLEDNRKIAIIFLKGEKDSLLLSNCNEVNNTLNSKIETLNSIVKNLNIQNIKYKSDRDKFYNEYIKTSDKLIQCDYERKNWKKGTFISGGTALGLLLLIILL